MQWICSALCCNFLFFRPLMIRYLKNQLNGQQTTVVYSKAIQKGIWATIQFVFNNKVLIYLKAGKSVNLRKSLWSWNFYFIQQTFFPDMFKLGTDKHWMKTHGTTCDKLWLHNLIIINLFIILNELADLTVNAFIVFLMIVTLNGYNY